MTSRWSDLGDDELLDKLTTALAPPEAEPAEPRLAPVVPITTAGRRRAWVAAAAAVAVLGAGGAVAAQVAAHRSDPAPVTTTSPDAVEIAADELEAALHEGDHDVIRAAATTLREAIDDHTGSIDEALRERVRHLLDEADAHPAPTTTTSVTTSMPVVPPANTVAEPPDDGGCDDDDCDDDDDGEGDDDEEDPSGQDGGSSDDDESD